MAVTNESYANLPFWNILPMGVTNYGGDIQVYTVPDYVGGSIGMALNPAAQAQLGNTGYPGLNLTPQIDSTAVQNQANSLLYPALNKLTSMSINNCMNNIAMTTQRLNAMLQDDKNKEHADEINALLDKLKEQEKALKELMQSTDLDPRTAFDEAEKIENAVRQIVKDASQIGKTKKSEDVDDKDDKKVDETDDEKVENKDTEEVNDNNDQNEVEEESTQGADGKFAKNIVSLIDRFYDATYRLGTDNDEFNAVCDSVNKDNVLDVMLGWKKFHGAEKNESFMTAFMYDADRSQKIKYGKQIARALRDKAEELGIYDECRDDFAAIDKEMGSWFYVDNDVAKNYDNIIAKIAENSGKSYNVEDFKY